MITLLQCRPQSSLMPTEQVNLPVNLSPEDIIFSTRFVVPEGMLPSHRLCGVCAAARGISALPRWQRERMELVRAIGRLNTALEDKRFICVGPGRWGSSNSDLGVPVNYGDIYNTQRAGRAGRGRAWAQSPEPSLGTHFFQDLLEAQIYPLAIYLDDPASVFNRAFFDETPNRVEEWIQLEERLRHALRVVRVSGFPRRAGTCAL